MKLADVRIDPELDAKLPKLTDEEFIGLEREIVKYKGRTDRDPLDDPIHVWSEGNIIIDGHNRYRILIANKMDTEKFAVHDEFKAKSEVIEWIYNHQMCRRNLTIQQKVALISDWEKARAKEAEAKLHLASGGDRRSEAFRNQGSANLHEVEKTVGIRTAEEAAKKVGMSEHSYRDAKLILEEGSEAKIERMNKGGRGNGVSAIANEIREGIPDGKRKCRSCGEVKDLSEFKKSGADGISTICKKCYNASQRKNKKIKPVPVEPAVSEPSENLDDGVKELIKKSYAPASYYDTESKPDRTIQDAIDMVENVCKDARNKIEIAIKRYSDILNSQEDREKIASIIRNFRTEIGTVEHNLRYTTHI